MGKLNLNQVEGKETIKIKVEISEIENTKTIDKINETKSLFENINEIFKFLST